MNGVPSTCQWSSIIDERMFLWMYHDNKSQINLTATVSAIDVHLACVPLRIRRRLRNLFFCIRLKFLFQNNMSCIKKKGRFRSQFSKRDCLLVNIQKLVLVEVLLYSKWPIKNGSSPLPPQI